LIISLFVVSCDKDDDKHNELNCDKLKTALIEHDDELAEEEIDKLTDNLSPNPVDGDPIGHAVNLDDLIEQLNLECGEITASLVCYACIETFPPQSEIKLILDSLGTSVDRIIDIITPSDGELRFHRIH